MSVARRSVQRLAPRRLYSTADSPAKIKWLKEQEATRHHAEQTTDLWRKISFYIAFPAIVTCSIWVYQVEKQHKEHLEHLKHENGGKLPEPPQYDYLHRRVKPFPWGNNSLFFNPERQKDMNESEE